MTIGYKNDSRYKIYIFILLCFVAIAVIQHAIFLKVFNPKVYINDPIATATWPEYTSSTMGFSIKYPPEMRIDSRTSEVIFSLEWNQEVRITRGLATKDALQGSADGVNIKTEVHDINFNGVTAYASLVDGWKNHQGYYSSRNRMFAPLYRNIYLYQETNHPFIITITIKNLFDYKSWEKFNNMVTTFKAQ